MKDKEKWFLVRRHIQKFIKELDENDLVSIVVFNDKVRVIGGKKQEEKSNTSLAEESEKEKEEVSDLPLETVLKQ